MKNKIEAEEFKQYLNETRTWESDKIQELSRSKKVAWITATAASLIAFMAVAAIAVLVPLKTVEPYVIRVDNSTGMVDMVTSMKEGKTNYDEIINKYFCQLYIRYREGYSSELAEEYYKNVGIMSASSEQQKYAEFFNPKNPLSPIKVYGPTGKVKINIKGTTFIKPNIALVRYTKEVSHGSASEKPQLSHFTATITFKYAGKSKMTENDRAINPLAFQVTDYRNDPDAAPITKPDPVSPPPPTAQIIMPNPIPTQAPAPVSDTTTPQGESR